MKPKLLEWEVFPREFPLGVKIEISEAISLAQKFNQEVVMPLMKKFDQDLKSNPDLLPSEFINIANEWRVFSLWLPRALGGGGFNSISMPYFLEEIASECLAVANLIGVHYVSLGVLSATCNFHLLSKIAEDILNGEKSKTPVLLSTAITEPNAGTDVEEIDLIDRGQVICKATRADNGFVINGAKMFISSAHLATWHIVTAYENLSKPSESSVVLAIHKSTKGFSVGRVEKKMGQQACPTGSLFFSDCFVSTENVGVALKDIKSHIPLRDINQIIANDVMSLSRAGVGAMGAGVARRLYEETFNLVSQISYKGRSSVHYEWVQYQLAEMQKNYLLSHMTFQKVNYLNAFLSPLSFSYKSFVFYFQKYFPFWILTFVITPWMKNRGQNIKFLNSRLKKYSKEDLKLTSGYSSLSKIVGSDFANKNAEIALKLLGETGVLGDSLIERLLRDAKLLQIYEGPNEINQLNVFYNLVSNMETRPFDE